MGKVYKVYHRGWGATIVMKCPKHAVSPAEGQVDAFERECETWINLGVHPHVVTCYFVRRFNRLPLVFAEYIEGGSLTDWIRTGRLYKDGPRKALARIVDIGIQMAWGLQHAHDLGLVHQDVKAANVLVTRDRIAKVTDFGLARARAASAFKHSHDVFVTAGGMTPAYCSPEQASRERLTARTDIWSFGLCLLEAIIGRPTWAAGQAAPAVLAAYLKEGSAWQPAIPEIPSRLARLLGQCFQMTLERRPGSMTEIAAELQRIYQELTGAVYARRPPRTGESRGDVYDIASLNNRAISLIELGHHDKAHTLFADAHAAANESPDFVGRALAMQDLSYNAWLLRMRTQVLLDEKISAGHVPVGQDSAKHAFLVGMLQFEAGQYYEAVDSLQRAVDLSQTYRVKALNVRGVALLLTGERIPAILALQYAARLAPDQPETLRNLAIAYYYDGRLWRSLELFRHIEMQNVLDSQDEMRYATVLAAVGLKEQARERIERVCSSEEPDSSVNLTVAELLAGIQTFLPWVVPVGDGRREGRELIRSVVENVPANLRAAIDAETYPSRVGFAPSVQIEERKRVRPGSDDPPSRVGGRLAESYKVLSRRRRWGEIEPGPARTQCMLLAGAGALLVALALLPCLGSVGFAQTRSYFPHALFAGIGPLLLVGAFKEASSRGVLSQALRTFVIPALACCVPPLVHHSLVNESVTDFRLLLFSVPEMKLLAAFSLYTMTIFIVGRLIYAHLAARMRAYGALRVTPQSFGPDEMPRNDGAEQPAQSAPRVLRTWRGLLPKDWVYLSRRRLASLRERTMGRIKARLLRANTLFGVWQAYLIPEFVLLACTDTLAVRTVDESQGPVCFLLMLASYAPLVLAAAFVPHLLPTLNSVLSIIIPLDLFAVVVQRSEALTELYGNFASMIGNISSVDIRVCVGGVLFIPYAAFFCLLLPAALLLCNRLAIGSCPAFAAEWQHCQLGRWDIHSVVDPLNLRGHAVLWQLLRPHTESRDK